MQVRYQAALLPDEGRCSHTTSAVPASPADSSATQPALQLKRIRYLGAPKGT